MKANEKKLMSNQKKIKTYYVLTQNPIKSEKSKPADSQKCHQQITWLEKIVDDIEWYKTKTENLFQSKKMQVSKDIKKSSSKNNLRVVRITSERKPTSNINHTLDNKKSAKKALDQNQKNSYSLVNKHKKKEQPIRKQNKQEQKIKSKPAMIEHIEVSGIKEPSTVNRKKTNNNNFGSKMTNIKATRKNIIYEAQTQKKYGTIRKNHSVELYSGQNENKNDMISKTRVLTAKKCEEIPEKKYLHLDSQYFLDRIKEKTEKKVIQPNQNQKKHIKCQRKLNSSVSSIKDLSSEKTRYLNQTLPENYGYESEKSSQFAYSSGKESSYLSFSTKKEKESCQKVKNKYSLQQKRTNSLEKREDTSSMVIQEEVEQYKESDHPCEADILNIFKKLDQKGTGILSYENCNTIHLSKQMQYILRPILLKVKYEKQAYKIGKFMKETQEIVDNMRRHVEKGVRFEITEDLDEESKQLSLDVNFALKQISLNTEALPQASSRGSIVMKKYQISDQVSKKLNFDKENRCLSPKNKIGSHLPPDNIDERINRLCNFKASYQILDQVNVKKQHKIQKNDEQTNIRREAKEFDKIASLNSRLEKCIIDRSMSDLRKPFNFK